MTREDPPVSIHDVARRARVSIGTVSNVLNRPEIVAAPTARRVRAAIEELGWTPSGRPRRSAGRLETLGIVLRDASPARAALLDGVRERLVPTEVEALSLFTGADPRRVQRALAAVERLGVQSVLLESGPETDALAESMLGRGMSVVILGATASPRVSSVAADEEAQVRLAVGHLLATGRSRIALIGDQRDPDAGARELDIARQTVVAAGGDPDGVLVTHAVPGDDEAAGSGAVEFLLDRRVRLDGLVLSDDSAATGALAALSAAGVAVPEQIAVVGRHDLGPAAALGITTVRTPLRGIGYQAADLLLAQRRSGRVVQVAQQFPVELVVRATAP